MCEKASGYLQDSLVVTPAGSSIDKVRAGARGLADLGGLGLSTPRTVPLGLQKTAGSAQQYRTGGLRFGSRGEWLPPSGLSVPTPGGRLG